MRRGFTPAPTASMIPAPSLCGMTSGYAAPDLRVFTSDGLTPEAYTRTNTSFGNGVGTGLSTIRNTSDAGPAAE